MTAYPPVSREHPCDVKTCTPLKKPVWPLPCATCQPIKEADAT